MKVSVIIPVYNAALFLEEAVHSALKQPECGEVLIIEDGSTDDSLSICERLASNNEKIKLLRHEDGKNHGAGASRNLGILNAELEWVAFLDADDFYLPGRFERAVCFLKDNPEFDGVAEAIGAIYEDEEGKERFLNYLKLPSNTSASEIVTGMNVEAEGFVLFEQLFIGKEGHYHLNGLLLNKTCAKAQKFDTTLPIFQDTHFIQRIVYNYKIKGYHRDHIVAKRRIHKGNRWNMSLKQQLLYSAINIQGLFFILDQRKLSQNAVRKLVYLYVRSRHLEFYQTDKYFLKLFYGIRAYLYLAFTNPAILIKAYIS